MANIISFLNKIKTAIHGKDVRGSIHDGIDAINKETEATTKLSKETQGKQDHLEKRWNAVVAGTTNGAEVIESRVDTDGVTHIVLHQRLESDFKKHDTQFRILEELGISVKKFGAKGDGINDDTVAFQKAIANAINGKVFLPKTSSFYLVNSDLVIPEGINFISEGASLRMNDGLLILNGNNILQGVTFDGNWFTKGVRINGPGCRILFNQFKNMKTSIAAQTNVINFNEYVGDAFIFGNTFDGIQPYPENGISTDDIGTARAIRIAGGNNITIESNTFKNMLGYEDSDYIHVHNPDRTNTTKYPYQAFNGYVFGRLTGVTIRGNTFYQALNKSCVKIQASGIKVNDNEFIIDYNNINGKMFSVVRSHNNYGTEFTGNKFYNKGSKLVYLAYLEYCEDIVFSDNKIYFDNPITYEVDCVSRSIFVVSCKHPVIKNNYIEGYNVKEDIRFDSCKFVEIDNNTFKYTQHDLAINRYSINIVNGQIGILNYKFTVENNKWYCESDKVQQINIESVTSIYMNNNNFTHCQFGGIHVGNVSSFTMQNNAFEATSPYIVNLDVGCKNIRVVRNKFGSNVSRLINILQAAINVKSIGNDFDVAPTADIFSVGSSGQDLSELAYTPGNVKLLKYDYGTTWQRPGFNKHVGYPYYDSTLNKAINWDGSSWRDAMGNIT
ncbi:hypothetical protein CN374_00160 [Bacillus cereus]|nr:hypothetical protein CN374_00160 [Bacillus cereus]